MDEGQDRKRVAVYLRVSGAEQREGQTIENQRWFAERWVEMRPELEVAGWYADDGVTGDLVAAERTQGQRLLRDAQSGLIKEVLIYDTSRLVRRARDYFEFEEALREAGVTIRSMVEGIDTSTEDGRMLLGIFAVLAQREKAKILERTKAGQLRKARMGHWLVRPPYGYRVVAGHLAIHEAEAVVVRRIFSLIVDEGYSLTDAAEWLQARDIPSARGKHWVSPQISRLIANPAYRGEALYNRRRVRRRHGKQATRELRDASEYIAVPCPPLVSSEVWHRAQEQMRRNRQRGYLNAVEPYLLSGLLVCPHCGYHWYGQRQKGRSKPYRYYVHTSEGQKRARPDRAPVVCSHPARLPVAIIEAPVWEAVRAVVRQPELWLSHFQAQQQASRPATDPTEEIARLERERTRHQQALNRLAAALADEMLPIEAIAQQAKATRALLQEAEKRLAELRAAAAPPPDALARYGELQMILQEVRQRVEAGEMSEEEKRGLLKEMIQCVCVHVESGAPTIKIHWR
jgi:site-specific DNA recombinase